MDAILTATARVLVKEGYDRASTNRIAQVAGVSVGSLYQFFPNKQSLFAALRKRHFDELDEVISRMEGLRSLPLRSAIRAGIDLMINVHAVNPELHKALEEEVPGMDVERNREIERRLHGLVVAALEERRAELLPKDLELAAFMIVQTAEALTYGAVVHHPELLADDRFAKEATDMIVRYLEGERRR